ncbi:MAG: DUF1972 domain-containing protein [Eubacterium sp.]|nr:DUF1972 domain-containing protein [Eubacterium sp.]
MRHVFILGSKSIGQYGGFETFVSNLIEEHKEEPFIKYHIICKANGIGYMDESKLAGIRNVRKDKKGLIYEFTYKNAHVRKLKCPPIGAAVAVYYDCAALSYCIRYCKKKKISRPIFYVLACRIGPFIKHYKNQIKRLGGKYYLNPDGHEWKRAKWNKMIRCYWKWSERRMVEHSDLVICDSKNIEKYIKDEYAASKTTFIPYGAETNISKLEDNDTEYIKWMNSKKLDEFKYYLIIGRFVPENNYETMIREFMKSHTSKDLVIVTNIDRSSLIELDKKIHFKKDSRIKFVGTVYNPELLKKIRENAYGYIHGHEVGGTNPSLLEALASTSLNMLLDVSFNKEVGENAALYWNKNKGDLSRLIDKVDHMSEEERSKYDSMAKKRIKDAYNWSYIGDEYKRVWFSEGFGDS